MLGMHLMLMIGKLGQYQSDLPDFMVFLGHHFLPWFWRPFASFGFAALAVVVVPGLLALVFGFLAFRSRIKGVYFSILTQALTYAGVADVFPQRHRHGRQQRLHRLQVHCSARICTRPARNAGCSSPPPSSWWSFTRAAAG